MTLHSNEEKDTERQTETETERVFINEKYVTRITSLTNKQKLPDLQPARTDQWSEKTAIP